MLISIASLLFFILFLFSKEQELVLFLLAYILFLGAVAVFVSPEKQSGTTYKDVNLLYFYFFCMLAPIAIITVIMLKHQCFLDRSNSYSHEMRSVVRISEISFDNSYTINIQDIDNFGIN